MEKPNVKNGLLKIDGEEMMDEFVKHLNGLPLSMEQKTELVKAAVGYKNRELDIQYSRIEKAVTRAAQDPIPIIKTPEHFCPVCGEVENYGYSAQDYEAPAPAEMYCEACELLWSQSPDDPWGHKAVEAHRKEYIEKARGIGEAK